MKTRLNEIHEYLRKNGLSDQEILSLDKSTYGIAYEICKYAHRNQIRDNGEPYSNHPIRLAKKFEKLIGEKEFNNIDEEALKFLKIPYKGVKEVCLLHDVIEDTDFKIDDIEAIFEGCGFKDFYNSHIKLPLKYITHNKKEDYEIYVINALQNSTASMVKMLDLQDNLDLLDLIKFGNWEYDRALKYMKCFNYINAKYKFIENCAKYRKMIRKLSKVQYFEEKSEVNSF
jgi:hypothetical protein